MVHIAVPTKLITTTTTIRLPLTPEDPSRQQRQRHGSGVRIRSHFVPVVQQFLDDGSVVDSEIVARLPIAYSDPRDKDSDRQTGNKRRDTRPQNRAKAWPDC